MKRYKLNIPEMIHKSWGYLAFCLDGMDVVTEEWNNRDHMTKDIPKDWLEEIIRAEPEVLTVEEIAMSIKPASYEKEDPNVFLYQFPEICKTAMIADKNGQIKEYKRLKPLIDAALNEEMNATHELRNLTPPWEPEK